MPVHRLKASPLGTVQSPRAQTCDALKAALMEMSIHALDAEWLLEERNLSIRLAFFQAPLREALPLLERDGIVKTVSRRGVFITRNSKREVLKLLAVRPGFEISPADTPTTWQESSISRRWKAASSRLPAHSACRWHGTQSRRSAPCAGKTCTRASMSSNSQN